MFFKKINIGCLSSKKKNTCVDSNKKVNTLIQPFTSIHLPENNKDSIQASPDFVGVGVPKSGTSWWYRLLIEHPEISEHGLYDESSATSKELHYFIHFLNKEFTQENAKVYNSAFARKKGTICGEFTTTYMMQPGSLERIKKIAPKTKIILLLRNPLHRTLSNINHFISNRAKKFNLQGDDAILFERYSVLSEALLGSLYSDGIRRILNLFDSENVLILQYEKCKLDSLSEIARTYRFLGVDDSFIPESSKKSINKIDYITEKPREDYIGYLTNYFDEDVIRTKKIWPELDLSLWPEFNRNIN